MGQNTDQAVRIDIRALLEPMAEVSGKAYFNALTRIICTDLGADLAVIGRLSDDRRSVQTLSFCVDGTLQDNITYTLDGTPCGKAVVSLDRRLFVPDGLQEKFPRDDFLKDLGIVSYAGFTLVDEKGEPVGLFSALGRTPMTAGDNLLDFMEIAGPRTRIELQHDHMLDQLREALSQALLLNYSKSMFMANISHELRMPLSAIMGYAALMRDHQLDRASVKQYAAEICSTGENLLALISDILSLATMEISDELARTELFDLSDIARSGRRMMQAQAAAKKLTLLPVERVDPLMVKGDARHTKKAMMNLLTNAVRYTSLGKIEITVGTDSDGAARLSISDTGVGMTPDELEVASRPLGAFAEAYDMHQEGTGLGLPLTALLMERQHGRLEIESEKGKGTVASLVFPKELVSEDDSDFI
ncbi:MAG: sensor histidine kinase [Alphaproteobacteria bacterium]|nr:MAG: sensor histidine kinase [Alphaproteobacteria bacterium]